jgi:hypothetical protein
VSPLRGFARRAGTIPPVDTGGKKTVAPRGAHNGAAAIGTASRSALIMWEVPFRKSPQSRTVSETLGYPRRPLPEPNIDVPLPGPTSSP